ncbi:MFS transporter [Sphingobium sp. Sx8-8]|uniref:spinster family MFS transporter n=1 Tax=Sphingobium sp. Sx8-8 TaxID=2933617 RepID=UPI001F59AB78|nr:MFS transporter [Sphingobium sp. Sx8-8]
MANGGETDSAAAMARRWWTRGRRHYVLFVLCLVGIVNFIDRQILAILLQPIQADLKVSDSLMGLLSGIAFSAFYVIAGVPVARMVDSGSRRTLLSACLVVWSVSTMLCGLATSFIHLALARIGVAAGEAGGGPASQSLLSDLYPVRERGTVIGIWSGTQAVGIALGLFLGGWLNTLFDWRTAFIVVGAPGLVLALVMLLTVREPPRGLSDEGARPEGVPISLRQALAVVLGTPALRFALYIAMSCSFTGYSILGWGPTFYLRVHGLTTMQVGMFMGVCIAGGLFFGNVAAGHLADRFAKGDLPTYLKVAGWGTILSAPPGLLFLLSDNLALSLIGLALANFFMTFWLPPTYAVAMGLVDSRNRGLTAAMMTLAGTLVGAGLGPLFVGIMSDVFAPAFGKEALRYALLIVLIGLVACGILCFMAMKPVRRAVAARAARAATA